MVYMRTRKTVEDFTIVQIFILTISVVHFLCFITLLRRIVTSRTWSNVITIPDFPVIPHQGFTDDIQEIKGILGYRL